MMVWGPPAEAARMKRTALLFALGLLSVACAPSIPEDAKGLPAAPAARLPGHPPEGVLLRLEFEGTVEGADGKAPDLRGTVSYEPGKLPGTKAVRTEGTGGRLRYEAGGNIDAEQGTVFLRVKADDWRDPGLLDLWSATGRKQPFVLNRYRGGLGLQYPRSLKSAGRLGVRVDSYDDARFYDFCFTWGKGAIALHVDGGLESRAGNCDPSGFQSFSRISLGCCGGRTPWRGVIDEMLIFDRALSASEVKALSEREGGASDVPRTSGEGAGTDAASETRPPSGRDAHEELARRLYQFAENCLRNNLRGLARKKLKEIIRKYPDTHYARLAREKLRELR